MCVVHATDGQVPSIKIIQLQAEKGTIWQPIGLNQTGEARQLAVQDAAEEGLLTSFAIQR